MTTTADLIASAKRWLQHTGRPEINRLAGAESNSDINIGVDWDLGSITAGAVICVDLEEMYVWTASSFSAQVQRGWNGSTPAAHSSGALVEVNPLFSNWRILNEINAELNSLSPQIYQVKTKTITATAASSYDLVADVIDVLTVQTNAYGASLDWPELHRWKFWANQDTSVFGSGRALQFFEMPAPGRTIRVTYAAPLNTLSTLADTVETVSGLPTSAADIPSIGAAARLLSSREARRSQMDAQPEARQAADVPPSTARSAAAQLFALRDRRIKEEVGKLTRLYPTRMRAVG